MGKEKKIIRFKNEKWRNFLDKFHVYGGLFVATYLIILGISSIQYQHHFNIPASKANKVWEQRINMPEIDDNVEFKNAVKDSLRLFGHTPWWQDYKDDNGIHHFMIVRPGKSYWVEVDANHVFKVEETRAPFLNVVMALHGLTGGGGFSNGPIFIFVWKIIAQIMNVVFLLLLFITVYFWYVRAIKSYKGWLFAGIFVFVSLIILAFIWIIG